ncbi:hypothetical protein [Streptomyces sp. NPDC002324]
MSSRVISDRFAFLDGVVWPRTRGGFLDEQGRAVEPVRRYLIDFVARYNRPGSVRSCAFDLRITALLCRMVRGL